MTMKILCFIVTIIMMIDKARAKTEIGPIPFYKTSLSNYKDALCLDGSPGAYYIQKSATKSTKWTIYHQGGGWCVSMEDCYQRSKQDLGSSKNYPDTMNLTQGMLSQNIDNNPLMYDWNKVFVRYCDGASFSGSNSSKTIYKGEMLHFRGKDVRMAVVTDLMENHDFGKATDVVISGGSAGGLAAYLHVDNWCSHVPNAKCVGMPDCGFFIDSYDMDLPCADPATCVKSPKTLSSVQRGHYSCEMKWIFQQSNAAGGVNEDCIAAHAKSDQHQCFFAEQVSRFIKSPTFALQSIYDTWQIGTQTINRTVPQVNTMGEKILKRFQLNFLKSNPQNGAFLYSCATHCGNYNTFKTEGSLVSEAIKTWYETHSIPTAKKTWFQIEKFPCKDCCHLIQTGNVA